MKTQKGFTRVDAIVTATCLVFLVVNIGALSAAGRGRARQSVCLANLRALTAAWTMYAQDWNGRLVNGSEGFDKNSRGCSSFPVDWRAWVGRAFNLLDFRDRCEIDAQIATLKEPREITEVTLANGHRVEIQGTNRLYKYCGDIRLFRCPAGERCEMLNYAIVDAMAGAATWDNCGTPSPQYGADYMNIGEIIDPSERFVFVDEGYISPDSWSLYYNVPEWFDVPPGRHNLGGTFSFADGHAEYRKWVDERTIALVQAYVWDTNSLTQPCNPDLEWVQIHAWGELGYDRSAYRCE